MSPTVRKIDYFGGLHGNYLELLVNAFIDNNTFDIDQSLFDDTGACHIKNHLNSYTPITEADHWSFNHCIFDPSDRVIRIVPANQDMLIAVTNSFLRTNHYPIDIENLEKNTLDKLPPQHTPENISALLIKQHGVMQNYPRSSIRNYFYSMFADPDHGLNYYSNFSTQQYHYHEFPFRAFFNLQSLLIELNKVAEFVNLRFCPTRRLAELHNEFLSKNQGYQSELKCKQILEAIFSKQSQLLQLNIVEEAWINYMLALTVNCYDDDLLTQDQYPSNTLEIANKIFS